jgi:hypothetical protein
MQVDNATAACVGHGTTSTDGLAVDNGASCTWLHRRPVTCLADLGLLFWYTPVSAQTIFHVIAAVIPLYLSIPS